MGRTEMENKGQPSSDQEHTRHGLGDAPIGLGPEAVAPWADPTEAGL